MASGANELEPTVRELEDVLTKAGKHVVQLYWSGKPA